MSRLYHRRERDAFVTWRKNLHRLDEMRKKQLHKSEVEGGNAEIDRINKSRTKIAQTKEKSKHKLDKLAKQ